METKMKKSDEALFSLLDENIKKRYEAVAMIKSLEDSISRSAEDILSKKIGFYYDEDKIYTANGINYKIMGIKIRYMNYHCISHDDSIEVKVYFISVSKTTKEKQLKIDEVRNAYTNNQYIEFCNYKVKLWGHMRYIIKIDNIFQGTLNNFNFEKDLITL